MSLIPVALEFFLRKHPPATRTPGRQFQVHLYNQTQKLPGKVLFLALAGLATPRTKTCPQGPRGEVPLWKRNPSREGALPPGAESAYSARPDPGCGSPKLK